MPGFPVSGGGYQIGDGNTAEVYMGVQSAPATAAGSATLTTLQINGGLIVANPSTTAATYVTPTGAQLDTALPNAKNDSAFETTIINIGTGSGDITLSAGTGVSIVGATVINDGTSAQLLWRRTADNTWVVYRKA
jgi:hypothetical protein